MKKVPQTLCKMVPKALKKYQCILHILTLYSLISEHCQYQYFRIKYVGNESVMLIGYLAAQLPMKHHDCGRQVIRSCSFFHNLIFK